MQDIVAESQSHVFAKRAYVMNTDISVSLEKNQAIQLDLAPNPCGVERYILYYFAQEGGQELIRGDAYLGDGERSGGGNRTDLDGALRQVGNTRCLAIIKWKVHDGRAQIDFRLSDDIERNRTEYRQYALGNKKMATQYRDRQLVPPIPLPEVDRLAGHRARTSRGLDPRAGEVTGCP
jgi:hypothetical protein